MPPVGRPRPDKAVAADLVTYLETELDKAALAQPEPWPSSRWRASTAPNIAMPSAMCSALEIDAASMLPNDIAGYGFDNNADALTLSPMLTERYLGAAAKISQMALARPRGVPMPETFFVPTDRNQNVRISDDLPLGSRGGVALRYYFPADGEYLFEMRPKESGAGGGFEGITAEPHQLDIAIDNVKVGTTTLGGPGFRAPTRSRRRRGRRLPARGPDEEDPRAADVPCAGQGRVSHGAGVLRLEDDGVCRRSLRPVASSRALSRRQRRAADFQRHDHGPAADDSVDRRYAEPPAHPDVRAVRRAQGRDVREEDRLDAGAPRVPPPGDRRRSAGAADGVPRCCDERRLRGGHRDGDSQHPDEPEVPVQVREPAAEGRGQHAVSHQRSRPGLAPVVLPVEQHPGRRADRRWRRRRR